MNSITGRLSDEEREDLFRQIEERAAIMEHDGGLDREDAERAARREVVANWTEEDRNEIWEHYASEVDMEAWVRRVREKQKALKAHAR